MPLLDALVLTALTEEFRAVLQVFRRSLGPLTEERHEGAIVTLARVPLPDGSSYVIGLASDGRMAGEAMSGFATAMFNKYKPRTAILCGIAAAADPKALRLADVAVADQVFSYSNVEMPGFFIRRVGSQVSPDLRRAANSIAGDLAKYKEWQDDCIDTVKSVVDELNQLRGADVQVTPPAPLPRPKLAFEVGAGGPFLVRDAGFVDLLRGRSVNEEGQAVRVEAKIDSKLAWIEMEAGGFMDACHNAHVDGIVMKGISDGADANKTELEEVSRGFWRTFATTNSAAAALATLRQLPVSPLAVND